MTDLERAIMRCYIDVNPLDSLLLLEGRGPFLLVFVASCCASSPTLFGLWFIIALLSLASMEDTIPQEPLPLDQVFTAARRAVLSLVSV